MHAERDYVEHLFRESIRERQPGTPEERRPRTFGGMGAQLDRDLTLLTLNLYTTELDKSMRRAPWRRRSGPSTGHVAGALGQITGAHNAQRGCQETRTTCYGSVRRGRQPRNHFWQR